MSETDAYIQECLAGFPGRVTKAMEAMGWSRNTLAEKLGCGWATINHWLKYGRIPDGYNVVRLAYTLNISADWLLGLSETGGPEGAKEES